MWNQRDLGKGHSGTGWPYSGTQVLFPVSPGVGAVSVQLCEGRFWLESGLPQAARDPVWAGVWGLRLDPCQWGGDRQRPQLVVS